MPFESEFSKKKCRTLLYMQGSSRCLTVKTMNIYRIHPIRGAAPQDIYALHLDISELYSEVIMRNTATTQELKNIYIYMNSRRGGPEKKNVFLNNFFALFLISFINM